MSRIREKNCELCQDLATTLFRVQIDADRAWRLICRDCYDRLTPDNPFYRYGGTWKSVKRG